MSKRRHGEGCWDSISVKGITYKRFRIDGQSFTGKTEKACKAKYLKWKNGQKTNLTDTKTTVKQVALEWLDSKKKHIKSSTEIPVTAFLPGNRHPFKTIFNGIYYGTGQRTSDKQQSFYCSDQQSMWF